MRGKPPFFISWSNVEEIVVRNTHFLMWDIGGQESLWSSWNTYYSNREFIILVDSIVRVCLAVTKEELYKMLAHEDFRKAAALIFANKQNMKGCIMAAEISKYLTLSSIEDHPWHIQACCALTGEGLCQGLEWMTSRIGERQLFCLKNTSLFIQWHEHCPNTFGCCWGSSMFHLWQHKSLNEAWIKGCCIGT